MRPRLPAQRGLVAAALASGVVIALTVVVWSLDVITAGPAPRDASTVRDVDDVGYDPMERYRGQGG